MNTKYFVLVTGILLFACSVATESPRTTLLEPTTPTELVEAELVPSPSPTDTQQATPTQILTDTPLPKPTTAPTEEVAEWDLVFISDSSGRGVGKRYAVHIENDLGVKVTLHNLAINTLSAGRVLAALRGEGDRDPSLSELPNLIPEAQVVVFYANPIHSISETNPGDWNCVSSSRPYVVDCSPETFDAYRADLDAIYEQIFALRDDSPIIIRCFDAYNPLYSAWREHGVFNDCLHCWENYNETIHQAAAAHNVPVAHVYDAFNGPNHDEDPRDKGYIGSDGMHTNETGRDIIADLLRKLGYEYSVP